MSGVPAEIRTEDLQNTSPQRYFETKLFGRVCSYIISQQEGNICKVPTLDR